MASRNPSRKRRLTLLHISKPLLIATFVGSMGGFVFGYDLGGLSAATESLRARFALAPWLFGLTISSSIWGTVAGSVLAGRYADRCKRPDLIAFSALLYALSAIVLALPFSGSLLVVLGMRALSGIAIGGLTVACPLYLSEIAPSKQRGKIVASFQLQVGVGIVVAFVVGVVFGPVFIAWRWILGMGAVPATLLCLFARRLPAFLLASRAESFDPLDPQRPPQELAVPGETDVRARLFQRRNLRPLLIATSISLFNQLSGVNILLLYMLEILTSAGINLALGREYTVLISCLGLVVTLVGMAFVDRAGRKPLLYAGSAGMALCLAALGVCIPLHLAPLFYLSVLVAYNFCFAFSQGTVVWVYLSEIFPPGLRGVGQGYGSSVHWIANAVLVFLFPRLQRGSTAGVFYLFALMMVVQIIVVRRWYPETAGATLGASSLSLAGTAR